MTQYAHAVRTSEGDQTAYWCGRHAAAGTATRPPRAARPCPDCLAAVRFAADEPRS